MIHDKTFPVEVLSEFLVRNDREFSTPLTEQARRQNTTFDAYMHKLSSLGTIAYELDEASGTLKGVVIGYTHNLPEDRGSYITQVVVDRKYQREGICSRLLKEYIEFCRTKGIVYVWLTTGIHNMPAQKSYEKAGFVRVPYDSSENVKYMLTL